MSNPELIAEASNPATSATRLQELAANQELWPAIAANPATYPGLLTWLSEQGGPEIAAVIANRGAAAPATPAAPVAAPTAAPVAAPQAAPQVAPQAGYVPQPAMAGGPAAPASGNKMPMMIGIIVAGVLVLGGAIWLIMSMMGGGSGGGSWEAFCGLSADASEAERIAAAPGEIKSDVQLLIDMQNNPASADFEKVFQASLNVTTKSLQNCGGDYGF